MLYYLVDLDIYLNAQAYIRYIRFVDDIVIVGNEKLRMLKMMNTIRTIVHDNNCEINEKKFYFQHYSKGVEFLGSHIKFGRTYINNKTIYRLLCKIRFLNNIKDKQSYLMKFQQSMNSYFGLLKHRTEKKFIERILTIYLSEEWWQYFKFNKKRTCLVRKAKMSNVL